MNRITLSFSHLGGLSTLLLIFTSGCISSAVIKDVQSQPPISIALEQKVKPIQFKKIVMKLDRGEPIGAVKGGVFCMPKATIYWGKGGRVDISGEELTEIFSEELKKANYTVVGDPNALFDDPSEWKTELLVAGLINDLKMNLCYPLAGFGDYRFAKGESYMKVNWQVYSTLDRKVIYDVATEGSYKGKETSDDGGASIWNNAFIMAVNNLLADKGFYNLVVEERKPSESTFERLVIANTPIYTRTITEHMNDIRLGVVTVRSAKGHGSGFLISPDGFLLTNQHVVGDSKFVKLILVTGREVLGEVIRSDSRRDVALIKIEEKQMTPLPILSKELDVGNEVYAIGSPLDEDLQTSVSRGVISGYRVVEGAKYIQSDVNVLYGSSGGPLIDSMGNVVGITERGRALQGVPVDLNFFIPIHEALNALNIEIK